MTTARLRLEPFTEAHLEGLNALNRDPEVVRYLSGQPESTEQTAAIIALVKARWLEWGYSWWSFIEHESGQLIGCGGIQHLGRQKANPLEVGWRLRPDRWGKGLALEAAETMLDFAFDAVGAEQICAVCHVENRRSERVMRRLGMRYRGVERWYDMDTTVYALTRQERKRMANASRHPEKGSL